MLEVISYSDFHKKSSKCCKTLRANFLPRQDEYVTINGAEHVVTKVTHTHTGSLPKVTVNMSTLHDIEQLIDYHGWRKSP
jgi:hypothetical protein